MQRLIAGAKAHPLAAFSDFRKLFAGRLVSAAGDKFFAIALAWWVISRGGENAKLHLGLLMAVSFLPVVVAGPFLGALADRFDRRRCMLWADAARFALMSALCALLWLDALGMSRLYALCFLIAAFIPLFESAVGGSLADLTDEARLSQAVAADSAVVQLSNVIGAALGSALIAAVGVLGAFSFNAASFLVSFAIIYFIRTPLAPKQTAGASYTSELKAGLRYIVADRALLALLCFFAAVNFFAAPLLLVMPMVVKFTLNEGAAWLAVFELFFALGAGLAALAMSFKRRYQNVYGWLFFSVLLMSACFAGLALTVDKRALCALVFGAGAAVSAGNAAAMMLFQHTVAPEMKGRFFAALSTVAYAVIPLAFALTGVAADLVPLPALICGCGAGGALLSFAALALPRVKDEI